MSQHALYMWGPNGEPYGPVRWKSIDCTLNEQGDSVLWFTTFPGYTDAFFQPDARVAYLRSPPGVFIESGKLIGDTMWLLNHRKRRLGEDGQHSILIGCEHPKTIPWRRVVAYAEGSAESHKSDLASEILWQYLNENLVAATDTTRNLPTSLFVLDPQPTSAIGPTLEWEGAYRNLGQLLRDAAQSGASQGVYSGYDVYVRNPPGPFHLRMYKHQRGSNRGATSGQPLVVGPFTARMSPVEVSEDWSKVVTRLYSGGVGFQEEKIVQLVEDTALNALSPLGLKESFESFDAIGPGTVEMMGYAELRKYRPARGFTATVTVVDEQYAGAIYDLNYTWGDIVNAQFNAPLIMNGQLQGWITYAFDSRVNPVRLRVSRYFDEFGNAIGQDEAIDLTLQSVDSL